jgi:hypothetical protein
MHPRRESNSSARLARRCEIHSVPDGFFAHLSRSFRGDATHRTRNLEIPRCAIAHLWPAPSAHPGMTAFVAGAKPLILPVVPTCRIPSGLPKHPNQWLPFIRPASTKRGASRSSRTLEAGCDGRKVSKRDLRADERSLCGRRSRMVLAPRRWRQVGDDASHHADDGGKKARSPGRLRISRKTIAQGRPVDPPVPVVLPRAFFCTRTMGACGHPAFPAPSRYDEGGS